MLNCNFEKVKNLLFLGAHSDDIEIGCGGTILKLAKANPDLNIRWVVFSADGKRRQEAQAGAQLFLKGITRSEVVVKRFKTSFFPAQMAPIKSFFETLKRSFQPDIVFTHYREDRHQDHRLISDLTWNTFRDHLILEYEIPKYDGDLGLPNWFVPLEATLGRRKAEYLAKVFQTQSDKHWFSKETFLGLMRLRGVECATRYAEAFHCRKMICGF